MSLLQLILSFVILVLIVTLAYHQNKINRLRFEQNKALWRNLDELSKKACRGKEEETIKVANADFDGTRSDATFSPWVGCASYEENGVGVYETEKLTFRKVLELLLKDYKYRGSSATAPKLVKNK